MLDDFPAVEREVAEVTTQLAEMKGRLAESLKRIKDDYRAPNLKSARKLVRKFQARRQEIADKYLAVFAKYKKALRAAKEKLGEPKE